MGDRDGVSCHILHVIEYQLLHNGNKCKGKKRCFFIIKGKKIII